MRRLHIHCLVSLVAIVAVPAALSAAPVCPNVPLNERLEIAPVAFVGKALQHDGSIWHFKVFQRVKGTLGGTVEIRAAELTDSTGAALVPGVDVGVFATLDGSQLVTDSCGLTDPAALLAVADEPRGGPIKIVIGILILLGVLQWSMRRRRRGTRPELPGGPDRIV